jgi:hypothetical protein
MRLRRIGVFHRKQLMAEPLVVNHWRTSIDSCHSRLFHKIVATIMITRLTLTAILSLGMVGCALGIIHLYPAESAAPGQPPKPIISGTIIYTGFATVSFKGPDGEKFSGPCPIGSAAGVNDDLKGAWDSVYGQGDYLAHVVGSPTHCTAKLTGTKGTIFRLEAYNETAETPLKGIAEDSNGNIYKVGS